MLVRCPFRNYLLDDCDIGIKVVMGILLLMQNLLMLVLPSNLRKYILHQ